MRPPLRTFRGNVPTFKRLQKGASARAEAGEAAQVIKKYGDEAILHDGIVRQEFIEEMTDVAMYLTEVLLNYNVSAREYTEIYRAKHARNMHRWDDQLPGE